MWREAPGHTLQATALVNELFLKLGRTANRLTTDDQFFRMAGHVMGQILIDHSRLKRAKKRIPRGVLTSELSEVLALSSKAEISEARLAMRIVFQKLEKLDPLVARTIWYRLVDHYTWEQAAALQSRLVWQVREDYAFGLKWLGDKLNA